MATTIELEHPRGPDDPLPTVAQIEEALDTLLTAVGEHQLRRPRLPDGVLPRMYCDWLPQTKYLPGEDFLPDPIGRSLREGVKALGETLFVLTGSIGAMADSAERVCDRDRGNWGWRASLLSEWWDGIGDGTKRWCD